MTNLWILLSLEIALLVMSILFTDFDYLSPSFVTILPFTIATVFILLMEDYWDVSFSFETTIIVSSGLVLIVLVDILTKSYYSRKCLCLNKSQQSFAFFSFNRIDKSVLSLYSVISIVLMVIFAIEIVKTGGVSTNIISNIGAVHTNDDLRVGFIGKIAFRVGKYLCYPPIFIEVNSYILKEKIRTKEHIKLCIPIISSFVIIFFSGARSSYLGILISVIFYYVIESRNVRGKKSVKLRKIYKPVLLCLVVFMGVFFFTREIVKGKTYTSTFIQYIAYYVGSPLYLFDKVIKDINYYFPYDGNIIGAYTFILFYMEIAKIGLVGEIDPNRFCYIGGQVIGGGNVYTIFGCPYKDFGYPGLLLFVTLFYLLFCILYHSVNTGIYTRKRVRRVYILGIFYNFVVMSFYVSMSSNVKMQTILEGYMAWLMLILLFKCRIGRQKR